MRLHGFQSRIAQRHAKRLLVASRFAFCTGRRRRLRRGCSPPLLGCTRFPTESCQNTFGDFQLIELGTQFFPFGIESREPLGNPLLFLSYRRRHWFLLGPKSDRLIDAFVDGLDLAAASFIHVEPKVTARRGYAPADLLKLYIYGYLAVLSELVSE